MTSLADADRTERIADVRFDDERMYVRLEDGREISVPLWWYPRLLHASPEQRHNWEILPFGDALHWPDIDEDLDVHGFLIDVKAPDARPPRVVSIPKTVRMLIFGAPFRSTVATLSLESTTKLSCLDIKDVYSRMLIYTRILSNSL